MFLGQLVFEHVSVYFLTGYAKQMYLLPVLTFGLIILISCYLPAICENLIR